MKKSTVFFLVLFCGWIPVFMFLSSGDYINPVILLGIYPVIVVPLYLLQKKYEKKESGRYQVRLVYEF